MNMTAHQDFNPKIEWPNISPHEQTRLEEVKICRPTDVLQTDEVEHFEKKTIPRLCDALTFIWPAPSLCNVVVGVTPYESRQYQIGFTFPPFMPPDASKDFYPKTFSLNVLTKSRWMRDHVVEHFIQVLLQYKALYEIRSPPCAADRRCEERKGPFVYVPQLNEDGDELM